MEFISYRQSVFLLSMILPVTGHFLLLPSMFYFAGHEAWITILLAMPIGFLLAIAIYRLHTIYPSATFNEMLINTFGKIIGAFLNILLLVYFLYLILITVYGLLDFIQVIFLPETPRWAIALPFFLVVLYAIYVGIESITRICELLLPIIIFTGSTIGIGTMPEKNYKLLFPIFENGFSTLTGGIILTAALYGEMILLLMVHLKKDYAKSKSLLFTNTVLVFLITFMFLGTVTGTLAVFGEHLVRILEYPAQSIVRIVSFGFIERLDIYGIAVIVFGSIIRTSALQISVNRIIRSLGSKKKTNWPVQLLLIISILFYSLVIIDTHAVFVNSYITTIYPLTVLVSLGLPFITWIGSEIRRKKSSKEARDVSY